MKSKLSYWKRIVNAYFLGYKSSNLSFWHTPLELNPIGDYNVLGRYYMKYSQKTKFRGPFDADGVPMLDYGGDLGRQYNPNAVAQYGLGFYDLFLDTGKDEYKRIFLVQADWFVKNIRTVEGGAGLWEYGFDFEYHRGLKAPWRSALAQGQGISAVARAFALTGDKRYLEACRMAFKAFTLNIDHPGGVSYEDSSGDVWFEELIFNPPTHVLNGFIWALWGVYDYYLLTGDKTALTLFQKAVSTLEKNIGLYDMGFWTSYHLVPTGLRMIASNYYQRLHIVQAEAMYLLTGKDIFRTYAARWKKYYSNPLLRGFAFLWKVLFKLLYY